MFIKPGVFDAVEKETNANTHISPPTLSILQFLFPFFFKIKIIKSLNKHTHTTKTNKQTDKQQKHSRVHSLMVLDAIDLLETKLVLEQTELHGLEARRRSQEVSAESKTKGGKKREKKCYGRINCIQSIFSSPWIFLCVCVNFCSCFFFFFFFLFAAEVLQTTYLNSMNPSGVIVSRTLTCATRICNGGRRGG